MADVPIDTERLVLRVWRDEDAEALHAMGQDARVMAFLGPLMEEAEARALIAGQIVNQSLFGHCFWAVERRADTRVIGFCGLNPGPSATPLAGGLEIGWRLAHDTWGQGYAHEAAQACLDWGWRNTDTPAIAAMTVSANGRSWRLMERLGMTRCRHEDFDHPDLPPGDPLRPQILYRAARPRG